MGDGTERGDEIERSAETPAADLDLGRRVYARHLNFPSSARVGVGIANRLGWFGAEGRLPLAGDILQRWKSGNGSGLPSLQWLRDFSAERKVGARPLAARKVARATAISRKEVAVTGAEGNGQVVEVGVMRAEAGLAAERVSGKREASAESAVTQGYSENVVNPAIAHRAGERIQNRQAVAGDPSLVSVSAQTAGHSSHDSSAQQIALAIPTGSRLKNGRQEAARLGLRERVKEVGAKASGAMVSPTRNSASAAIPSVKETSSEAGARATNLDTASRQILQPASLKAEQEAVHRAEVRTRPDGKINQKEDERVKRTEEALRADEPGSVHPYVGRPIFRRALVGNKSVYHGKSEATVGVDRSSGGARCGKPGSYATTTN